MKSVCALVLLQVAVLLLACSDVSLASPRPEDARVYVRDKRGDDNCADHEVFKDCGTSCETTCESLANDGNRYCKEQCARGCFCTKGYVRDDLTKKCIRYQECPRVKH